jgi:antitoxin component YwqK of YwqJK toxin-antitoxin module
MKKNDERINQHDAEGRPHGVWEHYRSDGTLQWRAHYHHGKGHGAWEDYRSDGTLGWRTHWHYGVRKGLDTRRDSQGRITRKAYHLVIR